MRSAWPEIQNVLVFPVRGVTYGFLRGHGRLRRCSYYYIYVQGLRKRMNDGYSRERGSELAS